MIMSFLQKSGNELCVGDFDVELMLIWFDELFFRAGQWPIFPPKQKLTFLLNAKGNKPLLLSHALGFKIYALIKKKCHQEPNSTIRAN